MANNRLYIRCTGCGEKIMIAKSFFGPMGYEKCLCGRRLFSGAWLQPNVFV